MKTKAHIQNIITQHLSEGWDFKPDKVKIKDWELTPQQQAGRLIRSFKLSDCRLWLGNENEGGDWEILEALDSLTKAFKLKVFEVRVNRDMNYDDALFPACEIGQGICQPTRFHSYEFPLLNFFWNKPYRAPRGLCSGCKHCSSLVKALRARRDSYLKAAFGGGSKEMEISKSLYRENLEANVELANAQISIAEKLDKLVSEKE